MLTAVKAIFPAFAAYVGWSQPPSTSFTVIAAGPAVSTAVFASLPLEHAATATARPATTAVTRRIPGLSP